MTTTPFTPQQFIDALHAAVAERGGDFVYPKDDPDWVVTDTDDYDPDNKDEPTCQYQTRDGQPACIIGAALWKIDPALVPEYGNTNGVWTVLANVLVGGDFDLDEDTRELTKEEHRLVRASGAAQQAQDAGKPWSVAMQEFDTALSYGAASAA